MMAHSQNIRNAEAQLQEMVDRVRRAAREGGRIDEVERSLFDELLAVGFHLLNEFVEQAGDGDEGDEIERHGQRLKRSEEKQNKLYRGIFGVLAIPRYVYAQGPKKKIFSPLDARLGLPAGEQSYVLEDWTQRFCVKESFTEGVRSLRDLLGVKTVVRTAETMSRKMAEHAESFLAHRPQPAAEAEEEILAIAADGKGVPVRRPLKERLREHRGAEPAPREREADKAQTRLGRGEKRTRKQMATVGAVYTIAPFRRTADDVLDEMRRKRRAADRPRPVGKQVFAEMTEFREGKVVKGQGKLFTALAWTAIQRGGGDKTLVCLMDGQRSLWAEAESWFGKAVGVLDIYHVAEWLWKTAYCFHRETSREAEQWVDRHLRLLLEGKVGCVIGLLKRYGTQHKLSAAKRKTLSETVTYFQNNRQYMRYDEYLAAGYPIGSGVVEGACRHLVKDRLEQTGMRWEIEGAQAMLWTRAFYLNGEWDTFIEHRIQCEQHSLYGQAA